MTLRHIRSDCVVALGVEVLTLLSLARFCSTVRPLRAPERPRKEARKTGAKHNCKRKTERDTEPRPAPPTAPPGGWVDTQQPQVKLT